VKVLCQFEHDVYHPMHGSKPIRDSLMIEVVSSESIEEVFSERVKPQGLKNVKLIQYLPERGGPTF
jgi:hypothetical protein